MPTNKLRVSVSLSPEVVAGIDQKIDQIHIRNRSHAIETFLCQTLRIYKIKEAIILIGGRDATKMISAAEDALKEIQKLNINKINIITGSMAPTFNKNLIRRVKHNINLRFLKSNSGTAGALRDYKHIIPHEPFLVINTNKWPRRLAIEKLFYFHKYMNMVATVYKTDSIGSGVYIFEADISRYIPDKGFAMLETDVLPYLEKNNLLINYRE